MAQTGHGWIVYVGGATRSATAKDRLLAHFHAMRARREQRRWMAEGAMPHFYKPAKQKDVQGLVFDGTSNTVGGWLPSGFDAYARLPNPYWKIVAADAEGAIAHPPTGSGDETVWAKPVHWSAVAEAAGRRVASDDVSPESPADPAGVWDWPAHECRLEPFVAERLFRIFAGVTRAGDSCLCGRWEGSSDDDWETTDVLLKTCPPWHYRIWRARFSKIVDWYRQSDSWQRELNHPNVLWPADRKWFLATLYSGWSNYVAGSRALIDAILASDIEAYEVELTQRAS